MKSLHAITLLIAGLVSHFTLSPVSAQDAGAVIDKGIQALGGEAALGKVKAYTCKASSKLTLGGNESVIANTVAVQGIEQSRSEFEGIINGNGFKGVTVVNGDKAWRKFGNSGTQALDATLAANERRIIYLQVIPMTLVRLKGKEFKTELAGEEKIGEKLAVGIKITGPDGKDFKLSFDKESGLPVRMTARVLGLGGEELAQEVNYSNYKEMGGIRKATKVEFRRDGQPFLAQEITEFKPADSLPAETFAEPN